MVNHLPVLGMWLFRQVLTSDLDPELVYAPHDHLLYAKEAFYLLTAGWLGPYDSCTLLKNPLIAYFIALARWVGFTYRSAMEVIMLITGWHLERSTRPFLGSRGSLVCLALLYFNPVTFDFYFWNVGRDGLLPLLTLNLSLLWMVLLSQLWNNQSTGKRTTLFFCVLFGLCLNLREEGLLYSYFPATLAIVALLRFFRKCISLSILWQGCRISLFALLAGILFQGIMRTHIAVKYGVFLYNDLRQGNFPKLIRALQSIDTGSKQTFVSITQKDLRAVAQAVPEFQKIAKALPAPPPAGSFYNERCPVSGEWPDSHHFIWIKDAIYRSGVAPGAKEFQNLCGRLAGEIHKSIQAGALLSHGDFGGGIITFPRNGMEWVIVANGFRHGLAQPFFLSFTTYGKPSNLIRGPSASQNFTQFGNMFAYATYTSFDSLRNHQTNFQEVSPDLGQETARIMQLRTNLLYWLRYPDVAVSGIYGLDEFTQAAAFKAVSQGNSVDNIFYTNARSWETVDPMLGRGLAFLVYNRPALMDLAKQNPRLGAEKHFTDCGKYEGRLWGDEYSLGNPMIELPLYRSPLAWMRGWFAWLAPGIWVAALGPLIFVLPWRMRSPTSLQGDPAPVLGHLFFCGYAILFALATAYISKNMGAVDSRLFYSVYLGLYLHGAISLCCSMRQMWHRRQRAY